MTKPLTTAAARPTVPRGIVHASEVMLRSTRRTKAIAAVAAVAVVSMVVLLFLVNRSPASHSVAFYPSGRATLTINGGKAAILPLADKGASLVAPGGAALTWQSADGWSLNLNGPFSFDGTTPASSPAVGSSGASNALPIDASGSFQLNGVDFGRWAGIDSNACAIVYTEVMPTRIAGSIRCRGLIWYNKSSTEHVQPVDVPPFDLDVNFDATGDGRVPAKPS